VSGPHWWQYDRLRERPVPGRALFSLSITRARGTVRLAPRCMVRVCCTVRAERTAPVRSRLVSTCVAVVAWRSRDTLQTQHPPCSATTSSHSLTIVAVACQYVANAFVVYPRRIVVANGRRAAKLMLAVSARARRGRGTGRPSVPSL
jgi:hypothetical protein